MRFIGSKVNLLKNIQKVIDENITDNSKVFCDIFGGTNSVAYYFKPRYKIITNDILYFSYVIAKGIICNNFTPSFGGLKLLGIEDPLAYLQSDALSLNHKNGFISNNYAPNNNCYRMYFTLENGKRIDFAREQIEEWKKIGAINQNEYYYLLAGIIEGVPYVSNITGTYGAYLKKWDKRSFKKFELSFLDIQNNNEENQAFNEDSNKLIKRIKGDILYIDPPYNSRQYLPNYHLLETIAKMDKPQIKGITGMRPYDKEKSLYCSKRTVLSQFEDLISNANFKHIIVSYSNDGLMTKEEIISILSKKSKFAVKIYNIDYERYKNKNNSLKSNKHQEYLFYIENKDFLTIKNKNINKQNIKNKNIKEITKTNQFIKSPLNYIGGKYKLLPQLIKLFPKNINTFVDVFTGGFNVGINVNAKKYICNDINSFIIEMYKTFKSLDINELISTIEKIINEYNLSKTNEEGYKQLRKNYNKNKNPIVLYVLICFSFNYQFRFNNSHDFNTPFGKNRSCFSDQMKQNLITFHKKISEMNVTFLSKDFIDIDLNMLNKNDFIYCDPPYLITTGSYNDGNRGFKDWKIEQEKQLLSFLDEANKKGLKFALSNVIEHNGVINNTLLEWSQKYNIYDINSNYSNCNYHKKNRNKKSREVLITNY